MVVVVYTALQESVLRTHFRRPLDLADGCYATLAALQDVFVLKDIKWVGESLCMFLTPLAVSNDSMAVIVSPLNALMDQQVLTRDGVRLILIVFFVWLPF